MKILSFFFVGICLGFPILPTNAATLYVDLNSTNATPPYADWSTAATNIQDAIDVSGAGDVVMVTNGIYATGGKVLAGDLTNRVALYKALTVQSVNGYTTTIIQGNGATNGTAAVRCAWLTNGAVLKGFTLQSGATRAGGDTLTVEGGAVWCSSTNAVVMNCVLTNNIAIQGGGAYSGTLNNCLIINNQAQSLGGGAYLVNLNNCTVYNNFCGSFHGGGGMNSGTAKNCILQNNTDNEPPFGILTDNYNQATLTYCLSTPLAAGTSNISTSAIFVNALHITSDSPGRGAGNPLYAAGTDLDGEPWAARPSMGCDEVVEANLVGPLSVSFQYDNTNTIAGSSTARLFFNGIITGKVTHIQWSFGDGPVVTNVGGISSHVWNTPGDYTLSLTAFNTDNPGGVAGLLPIHVDPLLPTGIQSLTVVSNVLQFQFATQLYPTYTVQYATNLTAPIVWKTFAFYPSKGAVITVQDAIPTNGNRFYRVMER